MSAIKSKNTNIEFLIRRELHKRGFPYSLHNNKLPGKPDIAFLKYNAVIFVHGCFWHGHHDCKIARIPKSNVEFWSEKISKNILRDQKHRSSLFSDGWRILTIWECALIGAHKIPIELAIKDIEDWLLSDELDLIINGMQRIK